MRKTFHGYYRLSEKDFEALWKSSLIVPDTNVLLHMYRWSSATRDEFLRLLNGFSDRLWLPHQVGLEFHRERLAVIAEQRKAYDEGYLKPLDQMIGTLESKRHPYVSAALTKRLKALVQDLKKEFKGNAAPLAALSTKDPVVEVITELFDGRVGEGFALDELEALTKEGEKRYRQRIPPGFSDQKKPEPERYGDLVLWKQILGHARSAKASVLFISDDTKEDWWWREENKSIGPHPLLRQEFMTTVGEAFHMYSADRFMDEAGKRLKKPVAKEAIQEARNTILGGALTTNAAERARVWAAWNQDILLRNAIRAFVDNDNKLRHLILEHTKPSLLGLMLEPSDSPRFGPQTPVVEPAPPPLPLGETEGNSTSEGP